MNKKEKFAPRNRPAMNEGTARRGNLYKIFSKICLLIFLIFMIFFYAETYPSIAEITGLRGIIPMPLILITQVLTILGVIMFRKKGRRHASPRYVELESSPGVLYLRPFSEDTDWRVYFSWGADKRKTSFRDQLQVFKFHLRMGYKSFRSQNAKEFGEIISELTSDFGKMAAIGEPGSPPILGADNVYVSDDNWKEKVRQMAKDSKLVILTAGTTPGVIWETKNMISIVSPQNLILNIPGGTPAKRRRNYSAFREAVNEIFPKGLPGELNARVLTFDKEWHPVKDRKQQPLQGTSAQVAWWMSRVLP